MKYWKGNLKKMQEPTLEQTLESEKHYCKCGCGQELKPYKRKRNGNVWVMPDYAHGHYWKGRKRGNIPWNKGRKLYPETIEKIKATIAASGRVAWNKGKKRPPFSEEWKRNLSLNHPSRQPEVREKRRQQLLNGQAVYMNSIPRDEKKMQLRKEKLSEWMKNGHAAYMNEFIRNPSKPQIEIFDMVKDAFPTAVINKSFKAHSGKYYSLDIFVPELSVAIEYDGSYWHQSPEKDLARQADCEESGVKFIRYLDVVPKKEEIINAIERMI